MQALHWLSENPTAFIVLVGVFGLLIGSFLNVVVHRLPLMMQRQWRLECQALLEEQGCQVSGPALPSERYNLVVPGSACPHCGHEIGPLENIPLLSWLALRGRCRSCQAPISARYPLVELLTGLVFATIAWRFGFSAQTLAGTVFSALLIAMTFIDIDHQLLPDSLTQPMLWLGLMLSFMPVFASQGNALLGVVFGYLSLWLVYWTFKLVTGKEGMGAGDFKLLAALGAWLGWQMLPLVILLSSLVGALAGIALILFRRGDRQLRIPFGPYLAVAGWLALLWGPELVHRYLQLAGLSR